MKQNSTILSTCLVALAFLASCTAPKTLSKTSPTPRPSAPSYIEGLTLSGGSNKVQLSAKTSTIKISELPDKDVAAQMTIDESETADLPLHSITDIRVGKANNVSLYSFIEEWYGTPYRFGGTSKSGIDCSAFVRALYQSVYSMGLNRTSRDQFAETIRLKSKSELQEGDLVFFKIRTKAISHVGVYLSNGKFVHASSSRGVVISDLNDRYWVRYYAGGGRLVDANAISANAIDHSKG